MRRTTPWALGLIALLAGPRLAAATTTTVTTSSTSTSLSAQLLSAKKLLLKWRSDDTKKNHLELLSKDTAITLGAGAESSADPTLHGGSLRVYAAGGDGFDDTYDLPSAQWEYVLKKPKPPGGGGGYGPYAAAQPVGTVLGYRLHKTDPFTSLFVKAGKQVKIVAQGTTLGDTLAADPRPVLVELRLGTARYCMGFGGAVTFTAGKKYLAKNATAAEAACPP